MKPFHYIAILLVLLSMVFFAIKGRKNQTLDSSETGFALPDTNDITQIKIIDQDTRKVSLNRQSSTQWQVNGKYPARPDAVSNLLYTIAKLQIIRPVPNSSLQNVMEEFKNPPKTVEIYLNDKHDVPAKKYFLGSPPPNLNGTTALMNNAARPYVIGIPTVQGHLLSRYFTREEVWRDRDIFNYNANDIATVRVDYTKEPQHSFELIRSKNGEIAVEPLYAQYKKSQAQIKQAAIDSLLQRLGNTQAESFENAYPNLDSLENAMPYCRLTVKTQQGETNQIVIMYAPVNPHTKQQSDNSGKPMDYDSDRYLAFIHQGKDLALIQRYVFTPLLRKYDDLVQ